MSHLTPSELVDLVDGQLEAVRARHVDACDFCRKQFDDLQESLRLSSGVEMPEPSALFWDHLSGRVREGIAETANERSWMERNLWRGARAPRFISAIAALLIVVAAGWYLRPAPTLEAPRVNPPADSQSTAMPWTRRLPTRGQPCVPPPNASTGKRQRPPGLGAQPDSVERAILDLDEREREQLLSLLEEELERVGT